MKKALVFLALIILAKWFFSDASMKASNGISFNYKVENKGNSNDMLPMLIAMHGNGDKMGNFYKTALDKFSIPVRIILIEGPFEYGSGYAWPRSSKDYNKYDDAFDEITHKLLSKFPTTGKPILLGFSGGARMAYSQALSHGGTYSYIFPISGRIDQSLLDSTKIQIGAPVFAYHGATDSIVYLSGGQNAIKLLNEAGIDTNLTIFSSGHHGIFTDMKVPITRHIEEKLKTLE